MNTSNLIPEPTFNHDTIIDRISRVHKKKLINKGDIIEWASECETDYIEDVHNMVGYAGIKLPVKNHRTFLPCNVYRILKLYSSRGNKESDVPFQRTGRWLYLSQKLNVDFVYIDFYGLQIGSDGIPLIMEGHMQAVEAFCVEKLYYEDFLTEKMSESRWNAIHQDCVNKLRETTGSFRNYTKEDLNKLHFIQYNLVPKIGTMEFSIDDLNTHFI